jgi:predicted esterase
MAPLIPQARHNYPDPVVAGPKSGQHLNSFIVLHGRGSNGELFGNQLLQTSTPEGDTLQDTFPHAKFIFPTAAKRRAQIFNRATIHQWFDNWSLDQPNEREELQFDGLRESSQYVHSLLKAEIAEVGASNVFLWGLSQGCAISLIAWLLWEGETFAAVIGMCGWLPLRKRMEIAISEDIGTEVNNPFSKGNEAGSEPHEVLPKFIRVVEYLREELQVPTTSPSPYSNRTIPIFLGHGTEDLKVPAVLGEEAETLLRSLDTDIEFRKFEHLGHWYSPEMLVDIINFIRGKAGWSPGTTHYA